MKILHLYHDLMNLYGEYGNVVVLKKHLEDQGFKVSVAKKSLGDRIDFDQYDFIYCGCGTEKNQEVALKDLNRKLSSFKKAVKNGTVVLFTGNAMEMLGTSVEGKKALGLVNFKSRYTDDRFTGDVIVHNDELGDVVGFINKCSLSLGDDKKLFDYVFKDSNLIDNEYEGYHFENVYGTHIIGPVLVKNPNFMKKIVTLLGSRAKKNFEYKEISYPYEEDSYCVTLNALKGRIKK